jgi:hypothetical protein
MRFAEFLSTYPGRLAIKLAFDLGSTQYDARYNPEYEDGSAAVFADLRAWVEEEEISR